MFPERLLRSGPGFLACLFLGCGSEGLDSAQHATPRDIVLIVIDTLRADHLGAYGYSRDTSPTLDGLAERGMLFTNATATSSWTRPAMASLFTARLPSELALRTTTDVLGPAWPTLAERLQESGYRTVGVSGNFVHISEPSGLARGFDPFVPVAIRASESSDMLFERLDAETGYVPIPLRAPTARELNERVFATLDGLDGSAGRPLFLYVHYMDPHSGYPPPAALARKLAGDAAGPGANSDYLLDIAAGRRNVDDAEKERLIALYDGEIASVDAQIGLLLRALEERSLAKEAVVIVVSDHGEEFTEHGGWFHGLTLHRELLHVPLIIHDRLTGGEATRRDEPVDLVDVAATVLALAGLAGESESGGRNLLAAGALPARIQIAELEHDQLREERVGAVRHRRAVTGWPWKAIVDAQGATAVYRIDRDPGETMPLSLDDPAVPATLRVRARHLAVQAAETGVGVVPELAPEERAALRALGYAE
ncbi:MAG: sulfatase [Myxococcota bacterium]|nr:sulfatase [Myxococcota bacterium]